MPDWATYMLQAALIGAIALNVWANYDLRKIRKKYLDSIKISLEHLHMMEETQRLYAAYGAALKSGNTEWLAEIKQQIVAQAAMLAEKFGAREAPTLH